MKKLFIVLVMLLNGLLFAEAFRVQGDLDVYHSVDKQTIYFVGKYDNIEGMLLKENRYLLKEGYINVGQQEPVAEDIQKDLDLMSLLENYNLILVYVDDKAIIITKENNELNMSLYLTQTSYYKAVEELLKQ